MQAIAFDEAIPDISKITLEIGGFFGGYETRTIQLHGNQLHLQVEHTIMRKPSDFDMEPDYPLTKEDFIEACEKSTLENGITVTITGTCWMEHNGN